MWFINHRHVLLFIFRADFVHKLAVSVITNNSPALRTIDLSHNLIEDKGMRPTDIQIVGEKKLLVFTPPKYPNSIPPQITIYHNQ